METKIEYIINPTDIIIKLNYYNYYKIGQQILSNLYKNTFNNKDPSLKKQLSFWSVFVNKKYVLTHVSIYTNEDIISLRREMELIAEFKLDECSKYYIIRKKMC